MRFNKHRYFSLIASFGFFHVSFASIPAFGGDGDYAESFHVLCVEAFSGLYPKLNMSEHELLATFSPERVLSSQVTFLDQSNEHLIEIVDDRGVKYIIRIGVRTQDIPLETFASRFYRAMGVPTPEIRKLNKAEREAMAPLLERAKTVGVMPRKFPKDQQISVALRHPGVMGYDHLIEVHALGPVREILMRMERVERYGDSSGSRAQRREDLEISGAFADVRGQRKEDFDVLYNDLRRVDPTFGDGVNGSAEHRIRTFIIYGEGKTIAGISAISESRIPVGTLESLRDAWVLSYVTGMGDMNPGNWMTYRNISFPIDLAIPNAGFRDGAAQLPVRDNVLHFPFTDPTYNDDPRIYFSQHMSRTLRARLTALTADEIANTARTSGIRLNALQINGVLIRARSLLELELPN